MKTILDQELNFQKEFDQRQIIATRYVMRVTENRKLSITTTAFWSVWLGCVLFLSELDCTSYLSSLDYVNNPTD